MNFIVNSSIITVNREAITLCMLNDNKFFYVFSEIHPYMHSVKARYLF